MPHRPVRPPRPVRAVTLPAIMLTVALCAPTAVPATVPRGVRATAAVEATHRQPPVTGRRDRLVARARYVPPAAGAVAHPFAPPAHRWEPGHRGVDLWAELGDVVVAPGTGVVTFTGSVAGKPVVVVTHPDGLRSSLEPVTATVSRGTAVRAGDPVGVLATAPGTAASPDHCADLARPSPAAACVHWGVRRGAAYVDPLTLLGQAPPIVLLPPEQG